VPRVVVDVMLKPEILDPQGQAVTNALPALGVYGVRAVRIGKHVEIDLDADADPAAVRVLADRLLANPVIEDYRIVEHPQPLLGGSASKAAESTLPPPTGPTAGGDDAERRPGPDRSGREPGVTDLPPREH